MARCAEQQLAGELQVINALNVFPVPDGDTGTNMLATIREALAQAKGASKLQPAIQKLSTGAMLGARGNSGVIMSQIFRAQCEILEGRRSEEPLTPAELARLLARASELARHAVANPVEGTMLSVLRAAAGVGPRDRMADFTLAVVEASEVALARTPEQLPILREAGVVDSGGYGLVLMLRGCHEGLTGQPPPHLTRPLLGLERAREQAAAGRAHPAELMPGSARDYGYCVTLLVEAPSAGEDAIRSALQEQGDSVLVAAGEGRLKLHVHVPDPEPVKRYARALGRLVAEEISNIDEQTRGAAASLPIVAVAPGEGLANVFRSLGAATVTGGQTQNPSTAELLAACQGLGAPVFLLPNNGNVLAAARQAATQRQGVVIVPTKTVPQGVAAALAYDAGATPEANLERMQRAAASVLTAELVTAARGASLKGIEVRPDQTMVIADGELIGVDEAGLAALIQRVDGAGSELATIYFGASVAEADAERLRERLRRSLPDLEVEIVPGNQPHALFIIGFE
jgi:DAK2 domain fusion protein YloV